MVEHSECGTNTPLLFDFIKFSPKPYSVNPQNLKELYLNQGLSNNQIAAQLEVSKATVLDRLNDLGIHEKTGRMTNPTNYRHHEPPYGYEIREGNWYPIKKN